MKPLEYLRRHDPVAWLKAIRIKKRKGKIFIEQKADYKIFTRLFSKN